MLANCTRPLVVKKRPIDDSNSSSVHTSVCINDFKGPLVIGSAFVELGKSKVICNVLYPRTSTKLNLETGTLECDVQYAKHILNVEFLDKFSSADREEHEQHLSNHIRDSLLPAVKLEAYNKQLITVSFTVLQSSPYDLSACVNAGSLALADAGVEMKSLVCSYPLFLNLKEDTKNNKQSVVPLVHPTIEDRNLPSFVQVESSVMTDLKVITNMRLLGRFPVALLPAFQEVAVQKCQEMRTILAAELRRKFEKQ